MFSDANLYDVYNHSTDDPKIIRSIKLCKKTYFKIEDIENVF